MKSVIGLTVNGTRYEIYAPVEKTLLEVLREDLALTGTKHGCELGECGACTVLINGQPTFACLALPIELQDAEITTIEGVGSTTQMHPLQTAFAELGAAQCGYCTPGMILSAMATLDENPQATRQEIREGLSGNLCRCTGYQKILEAVELSARRIQAGQVQKEVSRP